MIEEEGDGLEVHELKGRCLLLGMEFFFRYASWQKSLLHVRLNPRASKKIYHGTIEDEQLLRYNSTEQYLLVKKVLEHLNVMEKEKIGDFLKSVWLNELGVPAKSMDSWLSINGNMRVGRALVALLGNYLNDEEFYLRNNEDHLDKCKNSVLRGRYAVLVEHRKSQIKILETLLLDIKEFLQS